MKKVLYVSISLLALLRATTSNAADMPRRLPAEPVAMGFNWTGFYVGTHTGVAVGRTTTSNVAPYGGFDAGVPLSYELNPASVFGGGQIGYNWQFGGYVVGLESDIGYLGLRQTIRPAPDDYVSLRYGWFGTVTGRAGFAYDRLFGYVKGGLAVASITNTADDLTAAGALNASDLSETKRTRVGWTVGSGFEYAIAPAWSVKSEYMYMDFGKQTSTNLDRDTFSHRNQVHSWKVGLNYRFGMQPQPIVARY
jgi:outer membrane immunogenic protein